MTILSKSGPSTSVAGENNNRLDHDRPTYPPEPPTYADTVDGDVRSSTDAPTSTPTSPYTPALPPTNFANVTRSNGAIKGTWVIDTDVEVPSALQPPLPQTQTELPNLSLHTNNGSINATVMLTSRSSKRAFIKVNSHNGALILKIPSRVNGQPVKILATTGNGAVRVGLPRDFLGPVKFKTGWGKIKYSDAIGANTNVFSEQTAFVGDWRKSEFIDHGKWSGDILEVNSGCGVLSFFYADEMAEDKAKNGSGGVWKNVTGWFGSRR